MWLAIRRLKKQPVLCADSVLHIVRPGALTERDETEKVWNAIADPEKIVVVQIAPAVRAAWGEELGLSREEATVGKIIDVWRRLGADYVFDTSFSADLTIMEEGTEFLQRFTSGELKDRPMFTSCCPGWIRFIKSQYPHLVKYLSSAKSTTADVWRGNEDIFCREAWRIAGEDLYGIRDAMCSEKERA